MLPKKIPCKGVSSENGLLLMNRRPRGRKRQSRPRKYFVSYAYIERQYLFVNPLPCNYGQGEPNLHILQVSL